MLKQEYDGFLRWRWQWRCWYNDSYVDHVEMMMTMMTMMTVAMILTTRNREKAMGCCQPVSPIKSRSLWAFGNLPQNATDSHNYGKTVKCRWSCTETKKLRLVWEKKNCSVFFDSRSASGADDFGGADDDLINPVILTLVMVDHHFADEDYSGDDHRSYDDDHWSL